MATSSYWVAKCWKCGEWLHGSDDYTEDRGFYTCEGCQ